MSRTNALSCRGGSVKPTRPGPDGSLVALLAAVGDHHHPVGGSGGETLEGGLLAAGLKAPPLLQRLVPSVQEELVAVKVSLWGRPVERQAVGAVASGGQVADGGRT